LTDTHAEEDIYPKSFMERYQPPLKGERGDPRAGCNWCGSTKLSILYDGQYCSFPCYAAGRGKRSIWGIPFGLALFSFMIYFIGQVGISTPLELIAAIVYEGLFLFIVIHSALAWYISRGVDDTQIYEY